MYTCFKYVGIYANTNYVYNYYCYLYFIDGVNVIPPSNMNLYLSINNLTLQ